jgi:hypothetical protein
MPSRVKSILTITNLARARSIKAKNNNLPVIGTYISNSGVLILSLREVYTDIIMLSITGTKPFRLQLFFNPVFYGLLHLFGITEHQINLIMGFKVWVNFIYSA